MKSVFSTIALIATFTAGAAAAEGDAAAGERDFNKCKSCHSIVSDAGDVIVKGGRTGPNLWGVVGRQAGTADFAYGDSIIAAGEAGLVWDADLIEAYAHDPKAFLAEYLSDPAARSKMTFKLKDSANVAAYLASLSAE